MCKSMYALTYNDVGHAIVARYTDHAMCGSFMLNAYLVENGDHTLEKFRIRRKEGEVKRLQEDVEKGNTMTKERKEGVKEKEKEREKEFKDEVRMEKTRREVQGKKEGGEEREQEKRIIEDDWEQNEEDEKRREEEDDPWEVDWGSHNYVELHSDNPAHSGMHPLLLSVIVGIAGVE